MYSEDDMLMLSGIQHFRFCPRQWALIHIEQQWDDNRLTIEGQILHKHVDDPFYRQKCGDQITLRAVNIASRELGLYGISDAIELLPSPSLEDTILHPKYPGRWRPVAVGYRMFCRSNWIYRTGKGKLDWATYLPCILAG